jgi:hypothetical protein
MPVYNIDGLAYIEKKWLEDHKIPEKRKNMDAAFGPCKKDQDKFASMGVDLNRNFDVDFGYVDEITLFQTEW